MVPDRNPLKLVPGLYKIEKFHKRFLALARQQERIAQNASDFSGDSFNHGAFVARGVCGFICDLNRLVFKTHEKQLH